MIRFNKNNMSDNTPLDALFFTENGLPVPKEEASDAHIAVQETVKSLFEASKGDYDLVIAGLGRKINELSQSVEEDDSQKREAYQDYLDELVEHIATARNKAGGVLEEK